MRLLMVTPYPPYRDGIAQYALQSVVRLRSQDHEVEVLSPAPSAAHHHLDLAGRRGPLALAKRIRKYDRVVLQFHPDVFYPQGAGALQRAIITAGLILAFARARSLEVRIHEIDYSHGRRPGLNALLLRVLWKLPADLIVHTEAERSAFQGAFGRSKSRIEVSDHGADFVPRTLLDRKGARASLGIPQDVFMFLAIGFIQPHKGFDRAIGAFRGLGSRQCRLDVVGSVRVESPEFLGHLYDLQRLADATPGVTIHSEYVSDEEFDRWIVAADVLVLPYRHIWSSGVVERAALYGRAVIATSVGGLAEQARPGTTLVSDDEELAEAMRRAVAEKSTKTPAPARWRFDGLVDRQAVMAEIRARAAAARGGPASDDLDSWRTRRLKASATLRRLPPLAPPAPLSARPGVSLIKRIVRRLTKWQVDPIVWQLNELRRATIEAAENLAAEREPDDR